MGILSDTARSALGYWWNLISDAALAGLTVTETVSMANDVAKGMGGSVSFSENAAISQLYGYARRGINAGDALQAASPGQGITSDMMAVAPWARSEQEQTTYPLYHVQFEYTYVDQAGNTQVSYRTSVFPDSLPSTVGDLTAQVLDDAEGMAAKYGHILISAIPSKILVV